MESKPTVVVGLSGGVDSAVSALLLRDSGYDVQCLHMSNWEDDGYCDNAREYQDAKKIADQLGLPLHRVNFTDQYKQQVFNQFLSEFEAGRTPNPDVLCNRQIKFGEMLTYSRRLGGEFLATGHYARVRRSDNRTELLKGGDTNKDQSYFLHAVDAADLAEVIFPLGELTKPEVRKLAADAGLTVADKKDSTGICFIGERPFAEFLGEYLPENPGPIRTLDGETIGEHRGLAYYTLGQRQGLGIGGMAGASPEPWYVAAKEASQQRPDRRSGHEPSAVIPELAESDRTALDQRSTRVSRRAAAASLPRKDALPSAGSGLWRHAVSDGGARSDLRCTAAGGYPWPVRRFLPR